MKHACCNYVALLRLNTLPLKHETMKHGHLQRKTCMGALSSPWQKDSMVLNAVTKNVGKNAIASLILFHVGALLVVARRRSCSLIFCAIITSIILICATLMLTLLKLSTSLALGMFSLMNRLVRPFRRRHSYKNTK